MGKRMSQKDIQNRIFELKIARRGGMISAVAAFVGMAALIAFFLGLQMRGNEFANSQLGSMFIFIIAIVAAGVAGMGTRKWKRAKDEISQLEKKLK